MPIISQFNYLKEIYKLEQQSLEVSVSKLAKMLKVSQPSVTQQLRALTNRKLVSWKPRSSIQLTPKGEKYAIDLIRKHRIIESFLVQILDFNPLQAHIEAEELEHLASQHFVEGLLKLCGHPQYDPHGDPIPSKEGKFPQQHNYLPLSKLKDGQTSKIAAISESNHKLLQTMMDKKLCIGGKIQKTNTQNEFLFNDKVIQLNTAQVQAIFLKEEKHGAN
ncbi:MAG: metal-dependent transcriptional regulator [Proteobacteria bacterium]|nr:metal-dependent transcriptional regulator [Pseudomonadota bacterium]